MRDKFRIIKDLAEAKAQVLIEVEDRLVAEDLAKSCALAFRRGIRVLRVRTVQTEFGTKQESRTVATYSFSPHIEGLVRDAGEAPER